LSFPVRGIHTVNIALIVTVVTIKMGDVVTSVMDTFGHMFIAEVSSKRERQPKPLTPGTRGGNDLDRWQ